MARELEIEVEMVPTRRMRRARPKAVDASRKKAKSRTKKAGVAWCEPINICGQRFAIEAFFRDARDVNERGYEGRTIVEDNVIEVLQDAEDRAHDTLMHEILHAIFDCSGFKYDFRERIGRQKVSIAELKWIEETFCRRFAPALLSALRDAGWLQLPRRLRKSSRHRTAKHG